MTPVDRSGNDPRNANSLRLKEQDSQPLSASAATMYQGMTARLNCLGQDRSGIQFGSKELGKEMSKPNEGSWQAVEASGEQSKIQMAARIPRTREECRRMVRQRFCWMHQIQEVDCSRSDPTGESHDQDLERQPSSDRAFVKRGRVLRSSEICECCNGNPRVGQGVSSRVRWRSPNQH